MERTSHLVMFIAMLMLWTVFAGMTGVGWLTAAGGVVRAVRRRARR